MDYERSDAEALARLQSRTDALAPWLREIALTIAEASCQRRGDQPHGVSAWPTARMGFRMCACFEIRAEESP